jgi:predicted DNA-binding WGR domain protein
MRTFVLKKGRTYRFWNIVQRPPWPEAFSPASVTVCSGTTGPGEMQTTNFDDEDKSRAEAQRLIAEKLAEDYVETTEGQLCGRVKSLPCARQAGNRARCSDR